MLRLFPPSPIRTVLNPVKAGLTAFAHFMIHRPDYQPTGLLTQPSEYDPMSRIYPFCHSREGASNNR